MTDSRGDSRLADTLCHFAEPIHIIGKMCDAVHIGKLCDHKDISKIGHRPAIPFFGQLFLRKFFHRDSE